jgi:hypothetical protein
MSKIADDVVIGNIVTAFEGYAMDDIRFNSIRPISAGILIGCLLDQISGFFFQGGKAVDRVNKFVDKYLSKYNKIRIYDILRNPMVHHYSIKANYSVTSDPAFEDSGLSVTEGGIIYIPGLIADLEIAIRNAVSDLRGDADIRKRALLWHEKHKVLSISTKMVYDNDAIKKLWEYYKPQLSSHPALSGAMLEVSPKFTPAGKGTFLVDVLIKELDGDKSETRLTLEHLAGLLGLKTPAEYLAAEDEEG